MSRRIATINILWCIADTLICALLILSFGWCGYHFEKWWINLFSLIPLILFNNHTLVIDADIKAAKEGTEDDGD